MDTVLLLVPMVCEEVNVDMPALPLVTPVRVQLKSTAGVCWEARYLTPSKSEATQFKARSD